MQSTYNENCKPQLNVINSHKNYIDKSIELLINNFKKKRNEINSVNILDVGCSHGRNSNVVMVNLISKLKNEFIDKVLDIQVFHNDLEINNWTELFNEFNLDSSYKNVKENNHRIYTYGVGKSFYEPIVPPNSIDYCFMMTCIHWTNINEKGDIKAKDSILVNPNREKHLNEKINDSLFLILSNRLKELKDGGILITNVQSNQNDHKLKIFKEIKDILRELELEVFDKDLNGDEIDLITIPIVYLEKENIQGVLEKLQGFKVITFEHQTVNCILQPLIKSNGPKSFAEAFSNYMFSVVGPSIQEKINGSQERKYRILNEIQNRLINRISIDPYSYSSAFNCYFLILEKE